MKNLYLTVKISIIFSLQCFSQNIYLAAGTGTPGFSGDGGPALNAQIENPKAVVTDATGNLYFVDYNNNRIRKVNPQGIITTIAGNGTQGYSGDGGNATSAQLYWPFDIALDQSGNLYIADSYNNRIRKVTPSGIITTIAGTSILGYNGDGIAATSAYLNNPIAVTADNNGNIYIVDKGNQRIRKINSSGIISTIAGTGTAGFSGDGGLAINAKLNDPGNIAIDNNGNIYFADYSNNRIRKINTSGIITTVAGSNISGFGGDGGAATAAYISNPASIAFDASGNIYFSDTGNNRIRKINSAGIISTFAGGNGVSGGNGGPAVNAGFLWPSGLTTDSNGNFYIGDAGNNMVREICINSCLANISSNEKKDGKVLISPNPNNGSFQLTIEEENAQMLILNGLGQIVYQEKLTTGLNNITINNLTSGIYYCTIYNKEGLKTKDKINVE